MYATPEAQRAADILLSKLPGPANIRTRQLYRALERHYRDAKCCICAFYPKYGVMIVRGALLEHISDIVECKFDPTNITSIEESGLIERIAIGPRLHRITFVMHQPQEVLAS